MKVEEISTLLPGVIRRTLRRTQVGAAPPRPPSPLESLLSVMEYFHDPLEQQVANFPDVLDPRRAPDRFIPMLARWVDLDRLFATRTRGKEPTLDQLLPTGLGRLRELVANAAELSRWRGTRRGLLLFLRLSTGLEGFDVNEDVPGPDGRRLPFHIAVIAPPAARAVESLVHMVISSEKPAYVTYELRFADAPAPPAPGQQPAGGA